MNAAFTCDCRCHLPIGFTLRVGQTPPPGMKPCQNCERDHTLFATQTDVAATKHTNAVRVLNANIAEWAAQERYFAQLHADEPDRVGYHVCWAAARARAAAYREALALIND